ncbi:MAG: type IV pilus assembly protein PilM [Candidatus Omnitrophica bacterium]|nr:type IV pilus assembly protein PilM [Candidatus Omnitrophota bacterium]
MNLFKSFGKTGKDHIGIDIGSNSIKTVELFQEKDIVRIKNIGYAKIEKPGSAESIANAVKETAVMAKIMPGKDVAIAVPGSSVVVRFIELPRMNEEELRNAIVFEAEKYIPFSLNEVVVDHQLLIPHLGDNKMLVLLIAAKKDIINERLDLINRAGMSASVLDVVSLANVNAFLSAPQRNKSGTSAVVNIGAKATDINIIAEGVLYFTRSIQIGGDDLTKSIMESMSLNLKDAEELKINPKDKTAEVAEKTKAMLRAIVDEIRLSFSYYENQSGRNIEKVYLGGGVSKSNNICEIMKENLDVEIALWDPTAAIALEPSADSQLVNSLKYQMGTAIGLALR